MSILIQGLKANEPQGIISILMCKYKRITRLDVAQYSKQCFTDEQMEAACKMVGIHGFIVLCRKDIMPLLLKKGD